MKSVRRLLFFFSILSLFIATPASAARFIFFFIGDGMGISQVNLTEAYLAGRRAAESDAAPREAQLRVNSLPYAGMIATNSKSGVTDSAAAGTALASGRKTTNDAVAMDPATGERFRSLLEIAAARGMRTGIATSAFLQDATPAAFYAKAEKRAAHYAIGLQLAESGVDYFGGGGFRNPTGRDKKSVSLIDIARKNGYRVTTTAEDFRALKPGTKAIAMHPKLSAGSMPFAIDEQDAGLRLADFVKKGIELLDGEAGFFFVVEGGRIDTACHANDAAGCIREVIDFDEALGLALDFRSARPEETLVVAAADHETGGLSAARLDPAAIFRAFGGQKGSYATFERTVSPNANASFSALAKRASDFFGAPVEETPPAREAFRMSMTQKKSRPTGDREYKRLYGPYDPFTIACMRQTNGRAGVTWSTFYHTGKNAPIWAIGPGAEIFSGTYDNTEVFQKIAAAAGLLP